MIHHTELTPNYLRVGWYVSEKHCVILGHLGHKTLIKKMIILFIKKGKIFNI